MLTPLYVLTMLESFNGILSFALAATKLVLEAGAYFRYEQGPSGIPVDDGWWTVETGYYYYFDNDHKVPKTSLKERKNQKFCFSPSTRNCKTIKKCKS